MHRKSFSEAEVRHLHELAQPDSGGDRLRHALIAARVLEQFPLRIRLVWWLPVGAFVEEALPSLRDVVAPLCLFATEPDGRWSAAAVIHCSPTTRSDGQSGGGIRDVLGEVGISHVLITSGEVDRRHHLNNAFADQIRRAIEGPPPAAASDKSVSPGSAGFTAPPRPLYPPKGQYRAT